jgi:cyclase
MEMIKKISDECSMPFTVGGGIKTIEDIRLLLNAGAEKVVINTAAILSPQLVTDAARLFGSQSIIVSIDVKKHWKDYRVYTHGGRKMTSLAPVECACLMEQSGAGEIFLNAIDQDGRMQGYDIDLVKKVAQAVNVPVIACGGCGKMADLEKVIKEAGASAASAGSFFVFHGPRRAVLINFPSKEELEKIL